MFSNSTVVILIALIGLGFSSTRSLSVLALVLLCLLFPLSVLSFLIVTGVLWCLFSQH